MARPLEICVLFLYIIAFILTNLNAFQIKTHNNKCLAFSGPLENPHHETTKLKFEDCNGDDNQTNWVQIPIADKYSIMICIADSDICLASIQSIGSGGQSIIQFDKNKLKNTEPLLWEYIESQRLLINRFKPDRCTYIEDHVFKGKLVLKPCYGEGNYTHLSFVEHEETV